MMEYCTDLQHDTRPLIMNRRRDGISHHTGRVRMNRHREQSRFMRLRLPTLKARGHIGVSLAPEHFRRTLTRRYCAPLRGPPHRS